MSAHFVNTVIQSWPDTIPVKNGKALDVLVEPLIFVTDDNETITIPSGFKSDGGSIPFWARLFINPVHNQRAWWVHDWAWEKNRKDHATLLSQALKVDGCPNWQRYLIVLAVTVAGKIKGK